MAGTIKGITIEFGAETQKLSKAIKQINAESKTLQGELKQVEKLLKLDPSNTELLTQKQKLLTDAVAATNTRLHQLRDAAEQAKNHLDSDVAQKQYRELQREIAKAETELQELEKQAAKCNVVLEKAASITGDFGQKATELGQNILPVSAAVTGLGVAALNVATDFEKAMSGVQAITGATEEEFEQLRQTAINLGATTAFSSGEVAEAMTEMAKAGWNTTRIIDGMAGVLDATAASGEELGTVSTIVADAITGFGLAAKDSAMVADLLTQAANSGTIGVADLGESYKYIAPIAKSMGLSIRDVTTALSAMSMAGIKGSQAGTSLRTILTNMAKPTDAVAVAMEELNIEISNSGGTFKSLDEILQDLRTSFSALTEDQKAAYAATLAGKEGMSGLLSVLNLTQEEYDALTVSMNTCSGVAGETASIMQDNLQSKLEQLGGALESLAIQLADYILPFLTNLVEHLTGVIESFTNLDPWMQQTIVTIGGIIAATGPLLMVIGKLATGLSAVLSVLPVLMSALSALAPVFVALTSPIGVVIAIIGSLVLAFTHLWENNEEFRDNFTELWSTLLTFIQTTLAEIQTLFTEIFTKILNLLKNFATDAKRSLETLMQNLVSIVRNIIPSMLNAGAELFNNLLAGMQSVWGAIQSYVSDKVSWLMDKLAFWRQAQAEMNSGSGGSDGSHAMGLSYVPFDGYRAILHEGEAVLTKAENRAYREQNQSTGGNISVTQNFYDTQSNPVKQQRQAARELRRLKRVMA